HEALEVYRCKKSFLSDISATHVGVRPSFYRTRILSKPLMMRDNFNSLLMGTVISCSKTNTSGRRSFPAVVIVKAISREIY
ncbi:hypothetical protein, partial [Microbulbifer discodermiae]|uniref:hypothetical protein n=1 Tax=Microbulbifer sp. 2201CG32-9 TaxID=3232309 RepID=UPI00345B9577